MCQFKNQINFVDDSGKIDIRYSKSFGKFALFGMLTLIDDNVVKMEDEIMQILKKYKDEILQVSDVKKIEKVEIKGSKWQESNLYFDDVLDALGKLDVTFNAVFVDCTKCDRLIEIEKKYNDKKTEGISKKNIRALKNDELLRFKTYVFSQLISLYCDKQKCRKCAIKVLGDADDFSCSDFSEDEVGGWNNYLNNNHKFLSGKENNYEIINNNDSKFVRGIQLADLLSNSLNRFLNTGDTVRIKKIFDKISNVNIKFLNLRENNYPIFSTFSDLSNFSKQ